MSSVGPSGNFIFDPNLYMYLQPHILLYLCGGANNVPGVFGNCPVGLRLSGRVFLGSGGMLGGWPAPLPDPGQLPRCLSALRKGKHFLSLLRVCLFVLVTLGLTWTFNNDDNNNDVIIIIIIIIIIIMSNTKYNLSAQYVPGTLQILFNFSTL